MAIHKAIKECRKSAKLTIKQLAKTTGISQERISRFENDKSPLFPHEIELILTATNSKAILTPAKFVT